MIKLAIILAGLLVLTPVILVLTPLVLLGAVLMGVFTAGAIGLGLFVALVKLIAITASLAISGLVLLLVVFPIVVCALIFC